MQNNNKQRQRHKERSKMDQREIRENGRRIILEVIKIQGSKQLKYQNP